MKSSNYCSQVIEFNKTKFQKREGEASYVLVKNKKKKTQLNKELLTLPEMVVIFLYKTLDFLSFLRYNCFCKDRVKRKRPIPV